MSGRRLLCRGAVAALTTALLVQCGGCATVVRAVAEKIVGDEGSGSTPSRGIEIPLPDRSHRFTYERAPGYGYDDRMARVRASLIRNWGWLFAASWAMYRLTDPGFRWEGGSYGLPVPWTWRGLGTAAYPGPAGWPGPIESQYEVFRRWPYAEWRGETWPAAAPGEIEYDWVTYADRPGSIFFGVVLGLGRHPAEVRILPVFFGPYWMRESGPGT